MNENMSTHQRDGVDCGEFLGALNNGSGAGFCRLLFVWSLVNAVREYIYMCARALTKMLNLKSINDNTVAMTFPVPLAPDTLRDTRMTTSDARRATTRADPTVTVVVLSALTISD